MTSRELPLETASEVRQGVLRLARLMRSGRPAGALSGNKLGVLARLHRSGPASAGELAAALRQRPQSLTRVFAQLEADGLISRSRAAGDGRQSVLGLTERGAAALAGDMAERDAWLAEAMAGLTETEQQVLRLAAALMNRLAGD